MTKPWPSQSAARMDHMLPLPGVRGLTYGTAPAGGSSFWGVGHTPGISYTKGEAITFLHLSSVAICKHQNPKAQEQASAVGTSLPEAAGPGKTCSSIWCRFIQSQLQAKHKPSTKLVPESSNIPAQGSKSQHQNPSLPMSTSVVTRDSLCTHPQPFWPSPACPDTVPRLFAAFCPSSEQSSCHLAPAPAQLGFQSLAGGVN